MSTECTGQHHYYAANDGAVAEEGKVYVVLACTQCGDGKLLEFKVSKPLAHVQVQATGK